jgi:hypothetical protein
MAGLKRYPYGEDFQDKAAALLIRDRAFLQNHGTLVKYEYFDNEYVRVVVRLVLDYYYETNDPPTREKVGVLITDFCNANKSGSPEYGEMLRGVLNAVWAADLTGAQQIADTMIEFGRTREMEALARQLAEGVMNGEKPDKLWNLIDRSRTSLALPVEDEMDIAASFVDAQEIAMRSGLYNPALKIKTMIPTLDDCSNGGLGRKEVGIVLAPTGVGKSTLLVNFGLGAIIQRAPVLHFSVTELETVDLLVRYSARATGFISNDIAAGTAVRAVVERRDHGLDLERRVVEARAHRDLLRVDEARRDVHLVLDGKRQGRAAAVNQVPELVRLLTVHDPLGQLAREGFHLPRAAELDHGVGDLLRTRQVCRPHGVQHATQHLAVLRAARLVRVAEVGNQHADLLARRRVVGLVVVVEHEPHDHADVLVVEVLVLDERPVVLQERPVPDQQRGCLVLKVLTVRIPLQPRHSRYPQAHL